MLFSSPPGASNLPKSYFAKDEVFIFEWCIYGFHILFTFGVLAATYLSPNPPRYYSVYMLIILIIFITFYVLFGISMPLANEIISGKPTIDDKIVLLRSIVYPLATISFGSLICGISLLIYLVSRLLIKEQ